MSQIIDSGQIGRKSAKRVGAIHPKVPPMPEENAEAVAVYDDMKARLKRLGLNITTSAERMNISPATPAKWRVIGTPSYATGFLRLFERYFVLTRAASGDVDEAMRTPLEAVVADALGKGWTPAQVATVLRRVADETTRDNA